MKPQSMGGKVTALKLREAAIKAYYDNPRICKFCQNPILVLEGQKVSRVKKKQFCDHSCQAYYQQPTKKKNYACRSCGKPVSTKACLCRPCSDDLRRTLDQKTKRELSDMAQYWVQWRSAISKHARQTYRRAKKPMECKICDYNLHVDICHLREVADFPETATVEEINSPKNLEALCKNHHWEFDHGLVEVCGIKKARKRA